MKKLVVHLWLIWNFVVSRNDASLRCDRVTSPGSSARKLILRASSSIVCGCDWYIRFNWVVPGKRQDGDKVKITYICGSHTNTCDPSNVDQLVFVRTRASSYKKCTYQILCEIMVRMGSSYNIYVQSMIEILRKALPKRKNVDRHMVYNARFRARQRKSELESDNIEVATNLLHASFIKDYKATSDNNSKGKLFIIYYPCWLIK